MLPTSCSDSPGCRATRYRRAGRLPTAGAARGARTPDRGASSCPCWWLWVPRRMPTGSTSSKAARSMACCRWSRMSSNRFVPGQLGCLVVRLPMNRRAGARACVHDMPRVLPFQNCSRKSRPAETSAPDVSWADTSDQRCRSSWRMKLRGAQANPMLHSLNTRP